MSDEDMYANNKIMMHRKYGDDLFIDGKEMDVLEILKTFVVYGYNEVVNGFKNGSISIIDIENEMISRNISLRDYVRNASFLTYSPKLDEYRNILNGETEYYKQMLNGRYFQLLLTRLNYAPDADNSKNIKDTINKYLPKMSSFLSMMEDITFNELAAVKENDEIEDIISVASFAYSLGLEIPFEMADRILKDSFEHRDRYKVEEEYQEHRKALKAAFISLGQEKLLKNGIDDVPIVFGPLKEGTLGVLTRNSYITISEAVLDIYLEKNNLLYLKMVIAMNI